MTRGITEALDELDQRIDSVVRELVEIRAQRDELLTALKALLENDAINLWVGGDPNITNDVVRKGLEAIARAEGLA